MDSDSGKLYKSPIFTSSKNVEDRFVYSGWKKFVKESKLSYKDKVIFMLCVFVILFNVVNIKIYVVFFSVSNFNHVLVFIHFDIKHLFH
jgi:hypothetical protein